MKAILTILALSLLLAGAAPEEPREIRLPKPWNKLATLSDEQKVQLDTIRKRMRAQQQEIERRADEEMMAVLSLEQRAELRAIIDRETVEKKLKEAGKDAGVRSQPVETLPAVTPDPNR